VSEWRTKEQIEADGALSIAVARALHAYSDDPAEAEKFMLTEYVVVTARAGLSEDRGSHTKYDYMLANGSMPWHNMIGLVNWANMTMVDQMRNTNEDT
jgi:hypothetical protein